MVFARARPLQRRRAGAARDDGPVDLKARAGGGWRRHRVGKAGRRLAGAEERGADVGGEREIGERGRRQPASEGAVVAPFPLRPRRIDARQHIGADELVDEALWSEHVGEIIEIDLALGAFGEGIATCDLVLASGVTSARSVESAPATLDSAISRDDVGAGVVHHAAKGCGRPAASARRLATPPAMRGTSSDGRRAIAGEAAEVGANVVQLRQHLVDRAAARIAFD